MSLKKVVIINGSPRPDKISNTYSALMAEKEFMKERTENSGGLFVSSYLKIPPNICGCIGCEHCVPRCRLNDPFMKRAIRTIEESTDVLLGSPVYLDMPTPQTVAFLTRLNCMAESTDREFFRDKNIWLVATSFCSGTKTCLHAMMGAAEMLGFNLPGRGTREYIIKWDDKKLRGGMRRTDAIFLK